MSQGNQPPVSPQCARRTALRGLVGAAVLPWACAPNRAPVTADPPPSGKSRGARGPSVGRVGSYVSDPWSFSTCSYWIEGPTGLVLIDTQFLATATEHFVLVAEEATGKPVELAVVLHANPDKFNGTRVLQRRGIEVVSSQQVCDLIPEIHAKRSRAFAKRYAPDYPTEIPRPASFGDGETQLHAGGLTLTAHVGGAGCSEAHVWIEFEEHVFVGDLVAKDAHAWLEIGRPDAWLERIAEIESLQPSFVHAGRGGSGGGKLLPEQRAYLEFVIRRVQREEPSGAPSDAALERVRLDIEARYPNYDFGIFLKLGLPAVWRHYAA